MRVVAWIAASTTLVVMSFAMFGPVLAVQLQARGYGTAAIGAFAMIAFACVAVIMPFMPQLVSRLGLGRCYLAGMLMETAATLGYSVTDSFMLWCACGVLGGVGAAAVWNCTESLMAQHASPDQRGRVMGLYQTALGGALAAGPFIPALLQWQPQTTLAVAGAVQIGALAVVMATGVWRSHRADELSAPESQIRPKSMTTFGAIQAAPLLVTFAFAGGVFEAGLGSVSAANSAGMGLSLAQASTVVGALGLGSFVLQLPAGLAADRFSQRVVFGFAGATLLASALAFSLAADYLWLLWAAAWVWGGVGGALYTLTMIRVAHEFDPTTVAAGTAAMITGYTLGGAVGPLVSGGVLQFAGSTGLAAWLGGLAILVTCLSFKLNK